MSGLSKRNILWSGQRNSQRAKAKEGALHRYRDQERQARRLVAELRAREGWAHRRYRHRRDRPFLDLQTPAAAKRILDVWREPEGYDGETFTEVNDPTARQLEGATEAAETMAAQAERLRETERERRARRQAAESKTDIQRP